MPNPLRNCSETRIIGEYRPLSGPDDGRPSDDPAHGTDQLRDNSHGTDQLRDDECEGGGVR